MKVFSTLKGDYSTSQGVVLMQMVFLFRVGCQKSEYYNLQTYILVFFM
jgi:hypothetical protein